MPRMHASNPFSLFLLLLMSLAWLGGCSPLYVAQEGSDPHGYNQRHIEGNRWEVSYRTFRDLSMQEVQQFALRRAAEVARQAGYPAFRIVNVSKDTNVSVRHTESVVAQDNTSTGVPGNQTVVIPPYAQSYEIKRVILEIVMTEDTLEPSIIRVDELLEE